MCQDIIHQWAYQDHALLSCVFIGPSRLSLDFAFQSIATAHEAGQPIVSYVLKVVKVLPENARVGYKSCARSLQLPSSIAFDY